MAVAGAVIFLLSSFAPVERIVRYFCRIVRVAAGLPETEAETGALFAPACADLRSVRVIDFYDPFAVAPIPQPEFCFVGAVLGDLDEELWKDAVVLGGGGPDLDVCLESLSSQ